MVGKCTHGLHEGSDGVGMGDHQHGGPRQQVGLDFLLEVQGRALLAVEQRLRDRRRWGLYDRG